MVAVRVGRGTFQDFDILIDGEWEVVPRVGERLISSTLGDQLVKEVAYQNDGDKLVGVLILI